MDTNQYMDMFLDESREHLQSLNEGLLSLEDKPDDTSPLNEIFRNAHTLKGMSTTMGFTKTAELTHDMENLLDMLRKKQMDINTDVIDVLFECVDSLQEMIDYIASGESEDQVDTSRLVCMLSTLVNGTPVDSELEKAVAPPKVITKEEIKFDAADSGSGLSDTEMSILKETTPEGHNAYWVHIELADSCVLKAARAYMVMNVLRALGEVIKTVPSTDDIEHEKFDQSFDACLVTASEAKAIQKKVQAISEIAFVKVKEVGQETQDEPTTEVSEVERKSGLSVKAEKEAAASSDDSVAKNEKKHHDNKKLHVTGQSVRVDIEKLDILMNLVGELVSSKVRLEQIGASSHTVELAETLEQMDRVTSDLQAIVMNVRMLPVSQVFNRFPRMVRDTAKELKKKINLTIEGEDTELDRTVIDEIGDPLMHLLRNAVDHGIEYPDVREEKGKPQTGEVRLVARHEGNDVLIMVSDDGAGLDPVVIRSKAVEKGLITPDEAERMPDDDAVRLIFLPGFSTAKTITDVSGRGVGMDVVRSKIESLGGFVDVETNIDKGTTFKIHLPLTLAIIQAMLVNVQDEIYAIPLGVVDRTINLTPGDIKKVKNKDVIVVRGTIIPILRLRDVLGVPTGSKAYDDDDIYVVIVRIGERRIGIVVDDLIGQQEIVIKSLGKLLSGLNMLAGATILGDGHVAIILDVAAMV